MRHLVPEHPEELLIQGLKDAITTVYGYSALSENAVPWEYAKLLRDEPLDPYDKFAEAESDYEDFVSPLPSYLPDGEGLKKKLRKEFAERGCKIHKSAVLVGPILFLGRCSVGPFTFIEGPAIIGNGVRIENHASIKGGCYIDDEAVISTRGLVRGPGSYVGKRAVLGEISGIASSIMLEDSMLPHFGGLVWSVLGQSSNMAAFAAASNVVKVGKTLKAWWNNQHYELDGKWGAVINPGTYVGTGMLIMPGAHVKNDPNLIGPGVVSGNNRIKNFRSILHANPGDCLPQ